MKGSELALLVLVASVHTYQHVVTLTRWQLWQFVHAHNRARKAVGLGRVVWNQNLANAAAEWADNCIWQHSNGPYGENLAYTTRTGVNYGVVAYSLSKLWWSEKSVYDAEGSWDCAFRGNNTCDHYSQMVWRGTRRIGCAIAGCPNIPTYAVCEYDPPGNVIGQDPY